MTSFYCYLFTLDITWNLVFQVLFILENWLSFSGNGCFEELYSALKASEYDWYKT